MSDEIQVKVTSFGDGSRGGKGRNSRNLMMYYIDPVTERRVSRSTGTTDYAAAIGKAAVWQDELNSGRYSTPMKTTWEQFRTRYEDEKLATLAEGTQEAAATALNHFERVIDPARLSSITSAVMSRFQAKLRREELDNRVVIRKDTTIDGILGHLQAAFNWAVSVGMLVKVPAMHRPKRAKGKKMRGRPITVEEFERMVDKVTAALTPEPTKIRPRPEPPDPATVAGWQHYLTGLWLSGLRLEESLVFSWDEESPFAVDLSGKHPRFRIYCEAEKGHQDRLLPVTPDFAEFLLKTPEADRHGRVFTVLGARSRKPLSEKRVSRVVSRIGKLAGAVVNKAEGKYASAHDLRRSFGTRWAKQVMPAVLQKLMRHESIETTMAYYVDMDADDLAEDLWRAHAAKNSAARATRGATPMKDEAENEHGAPATQSPKPRL